MTDIHSFFGSGLDVAKLGAWLDGLSNADRIAAATDLSGAEQAALYEAAKGAGVVTVDDIVPPEKGPLAPVPHHGRNSLALFTRFQKVFCRPDDPAAASKRELWGYNNSGSFVLTFVGPGYYVAYDLPGGEVLVDYLRTPPKSVPGWPALLPNDAKFSRFVYNGTQDTLRRVSQHVTIGRAARAGKDMDNWFVLCRDAG